MRPKLSRILARLFDLLFQVAVQREAVVHIGEQIELRAMHQVAVQLAGFNGQCRQPRAGGERFQFFLFVAFRRIERRKESTQHQPGAGQNLAADNAQAVFFGRRMPEARPIVHIAPAGRAIQDERNHLRDVLDDIAPAALNR